jgi:hypothetical protein
MLNRHFHSDPIDRPELREGRVELGPVQHVASPRFVFRIEGSMWIYTDTVTGEERSFHGAELGRAWAWKDSITKHTSAACRLPACDIGAQATSRHKESSMALKGKKPSAVKKRLKALFFGSAGVGKTTAAIQFPKPYLIDTERGAENDQYVRALEASGGVYFHTTDFDEMTQEITALMTERHSFCTVIIDPLTVPYMAELDKEAKRLANKDDPSGTAFGRNKQVPDRKVKHLLNLLLRLDMNVIITSHAKGEWKNGQPTGTDTFDCYARLDYLFDLVFQIQKRGKERVGIVRKTRCQGFEEGEVFPFSYDEIAGKYGREELERGAKAESLASAEQVAEITRLVDLLKVPSETTDKWLEKAMADSWAEMPADAISKCISSLTNKLAGTAA